MFKKIDPSTIPLGHFFVLQDRLARLLPLHFLPPGWAYFATFLVLRCDPPPQDLEQDVHLVQLPHLQLAAKIIDKK